MIKLYGFGPAFGMPDSSPFVTKVDCHLRIAGIDYHSVNGADGLRGAPKSKLPYIDDDGELIADSTVIIEHLKSKYAADVDHWLTPEQAATAQLIGKSLEENVYWSSGHSRWSNDDTWPYIRAEFFDPLPFPLNKVIARVARRSTRKQLLGHGIGKHSDAEIQHIVTTNLGSLQTLLGDRQYFFGDQISSLDIAVFSIVGSLSLVTLDNEMNRLARSFESLTALADRVKHEHYPELAVKK